MTTVLAILLCAGLFALAAFLREPRRCEGTCSGCALGSCDRQTVVPDDSRPRKRVQRGHLTLEVYDD
jgi:hypothetical protein